MVTKNGNQNVDQQAIGSHPLVKMYGTLHEGIRSINVRYDASIVNLNNMRDNSIEGSKRLMMSKMAESLANDDTKAGKNMKKALSMLYIGGRMKTSQVRTHSINVLGQSDLIKTAEDVRIVVLTEMGKGVAKLLFEKPDAKPTNKLPLRSGGLHEANNEIVVRSYVDGKEVFANKLQLPQIMRIDKSNGAQ